MNEFELLRTLLVSAGHGVITLGPGDDLNRLCSLSYEGVPSSPLVLRGCVKD